ncbi:MAG: cation diffusion facilitator family transporter [Anaerolineae bacterium]|nr:cation diffusion facilitator family transporter [Anaerolineae bacterium]
MARAHSHDEHSHGGHLRHHHHEHDHSHEQQYGILGTIATALHLPGFGHDHSHDLRQDSAVFDNELGIRTVKLAFLALGFTTLLQIVIYVASGSVALLADTVHNFGDALNSIPLLLAFMLARRAANRRYTYGYGRAEDIAGMLIVVSIAFSAAYILYESINKLINPQPLENLGWVGAAAVIGFIGNEIVAMMQIRVGRQIGSEAMVADGLHARTDGLTSLAVIIAVIGVWLGAPIVDPMIGIVIGLAIVGITWNSTKAMWYRLMDAADPEILEQIEHAVQHIAEVEQIKQIRTRWIGHQLHAEMVLVVDKTLSLQQSYQVILTVRQSLKAHVSHLAFTTIQIEPAGVTETLSAILPPRYRKGQPVSAAPMGAVDIQYDQKGKPAWNEMWGGYCELALAGGPPHRGTLLEPVNPEVIAADPEGYEQVLDELERGIKVVTGLPVVRSTTPGWIGLECNSEEMAFWLLRAIIVENVVVRREDNVLYFPASPTFRLEKEVKNVITVIAKTNHYWHDHLQSS